MGVGSNGCDIVFLTFMYERKTANTLRNDRAKFLKGRTCYTSCLFCNSIGGLNTGQTLLHPGRPSERLNTREHPCRSPHTAKTCCINEKIKLRRGRHAMHGMA